MELPSWSGDAEDTTLEELLAFLDNCEFGELGIPLLPAGGFSACSDSSEPRQVEPLTVLPGSEGALSMAGCTYDGGLEAAVWNRHWQEWEAKPVVQPLDTSPALIPSGMTNTLHPTSPAPSSRPTKHPKRHGRTREQLIHLRGVVHKLETQLEGLRSRHRSHSNGSVETEDEMKSDPNTGAPTTTTEEAYSAWRQIATRQYNERCKAEKENSELKESLKKQIRVARRLEHLLEKQNVTGALRRESQPKK